MVLVIRKETTVRSDKGIHQSTPHRSYKVDQNPPRAPSATYEDSQLYRYRQYYLLQLHVFIVSFQ